MITRLNRELGDVFGPLSAALLFEHRTLAALARHLTDRHPEGCRKLIGEDAPDVSAPSNDARPVEPVREARPSAPAADREPIAIIGMSGRYPGADDLDAYWDNLAAGRDLIGEVPADRWSLAGFFEPDIETAVSRGQSYAKWGGFLDGFADFDPLLFKISPRERGGHGSAGATVPDDRMGGVRRRRLQPRASCQPACLARGRLRRCDQNRLFAAWAVRGCGRRAGAADDFVRKHRQSRRRTFSISTGRACRWTRCVRRRSPPFTRRARRCVPARAQWRLRAG